MNLKQLILISFVLLIVSFWNRNNLSSEMPLLAELGREPVQTEIKKAPFSVTVGGSDYQITPLYDYDLAGMVVSYQHHNGNYGLHRRWGDHLNVADFCVVWQDNAFTAQLDKLNFWNGEFTCNVQTSDSEAWASFHMDQLSNNHLLTVDDRIRDQLGAIKIGDQIRIRGWLSDYSHGQGGGRKTSTIRQDTGNGACETIFVQQVDILNAYSNGWRKLMNVMLIVFVLSLIFYLKAPYKTRGY